MRCHSMTWRYIYFCFLLSLSCTAIAAESIRLPHQSALSFDSSAPRFFPLEIPEEHSRWTVSVTTKERRAIVMQLHEADPGHPQGINTKPLLKINAISQLDSDALSLPKNKKIIMVLALDQAGEAELSIKKIDTTTKLAGTEITAEERGVFSSSKQIVWKPDAPNERWSLRFQAMPGARFEIGMHHPDHGHHILRPGAAGWVEFNYYAPKAEDVPLRVAITDDNTVIYTFAKLELGAKAAERELEKNDFSEDVAFHGSLYDPSDKDEWHFTWAVPEARQHSIRVDLENSKAFATAKIFDKRNREPLAVREGMGVLLFDQLVFSGGEYFVELSSASVPTEYQIKRTHTAFSGSAFNEAEPNDIREVANLIGDKGFIKGELAVGDVDQFTLDTYHLGEPQRWRVQVNGSGIQQLRVGKQRVISEKNSTSLRMSNLYLLPGKHNIELKGTGSYSLRAIPIGVPSPNNELEPNDEASGQAQIIPLGETITGALDDRRDQDMFRFKISNRATVEINISSPIDSEILAALLWDKHQIGKRTINPKGQTATTRQTLEMGEYKLKLHSTQPSLGEYQVQVAVHSLFADDAAPLAGVTMDLTSSHSSAKVFYPEAQTIPFELIIKNQTAQQKKLALHARSSLWDSSIELPERVILEANATHTVQAKLVLPANVGDSNISVEVQASENSAAVTGKLSVQMTEEANPVQPAIYSEVPHALRGGLNVAWSALGGEWQSEGAVSANKKIPAALAMTNNGIAPFWDAFTFRKEEPPEGFRLKLGGEEELSIAGIALNTRTSANNLDRLREFSFQVSLDGEHYQTALSASLAATHADQFFVFEQPIKAKFVKIIPQTNFRGETYPSPIRFQEFKVIAQPGTPGIIAASDIASTALGTHLVHHSFSHNINPVSFFDAESEKGSFNCTPPKDTSDAHWVIGLHHNRAALVEEVVLKNLAVGPAVEVDMQTSERSPLGPWEKISIDKSGGLEANIRATFENGKYIRFIRFTLKTKPNTRYSCNWNLAVKEKSDQPGVYSILGEWGEASAHAGYEMARTHAAAVVPTGGATQQTAVNVPDGVEKVSSVKLERNEDWFYLPANKQHNAVTLRIAQQAHTELRIKLLHEDSQQLISIEKVEADAPTFDAAGRKIVEYQAWVDKNAGHYLNIAEAPRSIVMTWDPSGSVAASQEYVSSALRKWAGNLQKGKEVVQIYPFEAEPLISGWADYPFLVQAALNEIPRTESSDGEASLIQATELLKTQIGTKAVVITTDANAPRNAALWQNLARTCPRIFAVGLAASSSHDGLPERALEDRMQDWASACQGEYRSSNGFSDVEEGFRSASVRIREPKSYALTAKHLQLQPPLPGTLKVEIDPILRGKIADSIFIILDTSGSMLQSIQGQTRMDVAKKSMLAMVANIPEGINFGLMTFGKVQDSCDTPTVIDFSRFSKIRTEAAVKNLIAVNLVKTPLADALNQAGAKIKMQQGKKSILLITDGEETCDGNPEQAIKALRADGLDAKVSIVGFALESEALSNTFESWAHIGGGEYFEAQDQAALLKALDDSMRPKFTVLSVSQEVIAEGKVGDTIPLAPGSYIVVLDNQDTQELIQVKPNTLATVRFR